MEALPAPKTAPTLNPTLKPFWLEQARIRVLYGGRYSSKTWDAAGFAVYLASNYQVRFLCTRQFQNRIEESVYVTIKTQVIRFGLAHEFIFLRNKIIHKETGSEFLFYGLWRHIDEIKSLEGVDICWIEEAHNLKKNQWQILRDTIRKPYSQFWIVFNPNLATDFVYQRFVVDPPPRTVLRKINYDENPFLPETVLQTIQEVRDEDEDEYRHVYLGEPRQNDEQAIIKRAWIEAAIDAHVALGIDIEGSDRIGYDVADDGGDKNALVRAKGVVCLDAEEWQGGEDRIVESCSRVYGQAVEHGAAIVYDSIGVGAGAGSIFKKLNEARERAIKYTGWNAGGKVERPAREYRPGVKNRDHFANAKAQAWWTVADRFRMTYNAVTKGADFDPGEIISLASDCGNLEKLITELSTPRRDFDGAGRVRVETKKDLAKREVPSPNLADAYIMAFADVRKKTVWQAV